MYFFMLLIGLNFYSNAVILMYFFAIYISLIISRSKNVHRTFLYVFFLFIGIIISIMYNNAEDSIKSIFKFSLYPILFYSVYSMDSYFTFNKWKKDDIIVFFYYLMFFFALGNVTHMVANMLITDIDAINLGKRYINDIWTNNTAPATIFIGWGSSIAPIFLYSYEKRRQNLLLFLLSLIMLIVSIIFSFILATRMMLVNFMVIILVFFLTKLLWKEISINFKLILRYFAVFFSMMLFFMFSSRSIGKVKHYIMNTNLTARLSGDSMSFFDSNGRVEVTRYLIEHFTESVWGGSYFTKQYGLQQHNMVFQMYDLYGIVAFLMLLIILIIAIRYTLTIYKSKNISNAEKRFILLTVLSLMIYSLEEPLLTSNFIISCMLYIYIPFLIMISNKKDEKILLDVEV